MKEILERIDDGVATFETGYEEADFQADLRSIDESLTRLEELEKKEVPMKGLIELCKDEWWCMFYKCPNCGSKNIARGFKYCPDCGQKLDDEEYYK